MFDKLNRLVLDHLEKKSAQREPSIAAIELTASGFSLLTHANPRPSLQRTAVDWVHIQRIDAIRQPSYVGDCIVLVVSFNSGQFTVTEDTAGYASWVDACEQHLSPIKPKAVWQVETVAAELDRAINIYIAT